MTCPYQRELKRNENGYIEHFLKCDERECMYYTIATDPPCLKACIEFRYYEKEVG